MPTDYKIIGADGREYGPATLEEIRDWIVDGRVDRLTMVWRSDEQRWQAAGRWEELVWDLPVPPPLTPRTAPVVPTWVPAGFWVRFAAYFVDFLIVVMVLRFVMLPYAEQFQEVGRVVQSVKPEELAQDTTKLLAFYRQVLPLLFMQALIQAVISLTYFVGFNGRFGYTPGKWLVGIQVVNADGSPLGYRRAFWRYSAELVSWLTLGLGYLMVAFNPEKRGLHDSMAHTRVVYRL